MIQPEFAYRFVGDSGVDIARQDIDAVFPDGERRRVVLRLGVPFEQGGRTAIRAELENLDRTDGPLAGHGSLHAVVLGLAWIPARLDVYHRRHGCRYFFPDSDEAFDANAYFGVFYKPA